MKLLSLKEIQNADLDILKDVDAFCRSHGIKYAMAYGTLLGAVRHKGFIPWDDDIDLIMRREDYIRFQKEYSSEKYSFISRETTAECWLTFGRVTDTKHSKVIGTIPWHSDKLSCGAWVDIFPMDAVPDNKEGFMSIYRILNTLQYQLRKTRGAHSYFIKGMPLRDRLKICWKKKVNPNLVKIDPSVFAQDFINTLRLLTSAPTGHIGQLGCPDSPNSYFDKSLLESYVDLPFEDGLFMAPAQYTDFLKAVYGDTYMQLPPKKERVTDLYRFAPIYSL
jgi:lipopolysaccharide cholinephosphotransferase